MGLPAARLGDEVAHSNAMMGLLIGAALGAALAVAVVATGGLAAVAAGAMIAGGIAGGALAGEYVGAASMGPPTGAITIGSPNVFVNGRPAAMTNIALAICAKEYGVPQPIAMGAATVFINGMPAARKTDKLVCSAQIIQGSGDVFYDDKTVQTLDISPEVPEWLNTTLQVVAVGALIVGFGAAVVAVGFGAATVGLVGGIVGGELGSMGGRALGQALGLSESGQRAMEVGGGFLGGLLGGSAATKAYEGLGRNPEGIVTPSSEEVCTNGCPISMHTGEELLTLVDFTWEGPLALVWKRFYRTAQSATDLQLGHGWLTPLDEWIELGPDGDLTWHDREGRRIPLPLPASGAHAVNVAERTRVERRGDVVRIQPRQGPASLFTLGAGRCPLEAWSGPDGHRIDLVYDEQARVASLRDAFGRALIVERAGHRIAALVPAEVTPQGLRATGAPLVRYACDAAGDLVASVDRLDHGERYEYAGHLLARRTLATGFSFRYEWDADGPGARCVRNWGDGGLYDYRFQWDAPRAGLVVSRAIDSRGGVTEYAHDAAGRLVRFVSPEGVAETYRYADNRLLAEAHGPLGLVQRLAYDAEGHIVRKEDAEGAVQQMRYDVDGRLVELRDALGQARTWAFDLHGRLLRTVDPAGGVRRYEYNPQGLLAREFDPVGRVRVLWWDLRARVVAELGFDGLRRLFAHDADGRVVRATLQEERSESFEWDPVGRLVALRGADGAELSLRYNERGRLVQWRDASGQSVEFVYRAGLDQPSERIDALGHVLRYRYDTECNLVALVNAKGEEYRLDWDLDDRLVGETGFDGREQRYEYDGAGRIVAKSDADGSVLHLYRDRVGRLVRLAASDGLALAWAYDPLGRLVEAAAPGHVVRYAFDPCGRVTQEEQGEAVLAHAYDAAGQRIATVLPDGRRLAYSWGAPGRLAEVTLDGHPLSRHQRDKFAQESARDQGAVRTRFERDVSGRLSAQVTSLAVDDSVLLRREYGRDRAGRVDFVADARFGETRYVYDPVDRLVEARGATSEAFAHDPAGNLLVDGQGEIARDRLLAQGERRFRHDACGNRVEEVDVRRGSTRRFEYDARQQLVAVHADDGTTRYRYDALGRRIAKLTARGERHFVWDGATLAGERDEAGAARWYVYEPGTFLPLACVQSVDGTVFHYHLDHVGTPFAMTDKAGRVVWSARARAWGALALADVQEVENPLRFQGQYHDEETGLHYNFQRYYDPRAGRFLQQDPIGLAGGSNLYAYAPNPVMWIDPWGLTGTYIFTDGSTSYVGKGPESRMNDSMRERIGGSSNATQWAHEDYGSNDTGFMVEHRMMEKYDARNSPDFANSENRSSPGKRLYEAADPATRAQVDAHADALDAKYKASGGCKP